MKKLRFSAGLCLVVFAISCAAGPQSRETSPAKAPDINSPIAGSNAPESGPQAAVEQPVAGTSESSAESLVSNERFADSFENSSGLSQEAGPPVRPVIPPVPENIMGKGILTANAMAGFLLEVNTGLDTEFVENLALFYMEEASLEGVNHDAAFAQMCLETGFLRYGNLVTPDMNNFCGLGAIGPGQTGERFPDPRTGVRAHIQHLKAYATEEPLEQELVDPRYFYVRLGSSPAIKGLSGTWAADRSYASKISDIIERLYNFSFNKP